MPTAGGKLNKAQQSLLIVSGVLFLAYFVPVLRWPLLPFHYLYTHLHELGHAIAAMATGGQFIRIELAPDGSGVTTSNGGWQLFVSPAGYVGATAFGAGILALSRNAKGAQIAFRVLFAIMAIGMLCWIRGVFGFATGLVFTALFGWLGFRKDDGHTQWLAQFLGVFLSLSSIQAVLITLHIGGMAMGEDDAMILERTTGIPAVFSALVWTAVSVAIAIWGLRRAWAGR